MTDTIPQATLDEALVPELSGDFFYLLGRKVQLKPLKVRYQIAFARKLSEVAKLTAVDLQDQQWLSALAEVTNHYEVLPELVLILAQNDGHAITAEQLLDSDTPLGEMVDAVVRFAKKNEAIGRPVTDFFSTVLPAVRKLVLAELAKVKTRLAEADTSPTP